MKCNDAEALKKKLTTIANGEYTGGVKYARDVLSDAMRHGIFKKEDVAVALGCEIPHIGRKLQSLKSLEGPIRSLVCP